MFCRSALLLSVCENGLCLSQLIKKLNSTERGALFRHFCVSKVITTAHAHKSGVIFHFFPRSFKKKIKALRPKMTKIASRGGSCQVTDEPGSKAAMAGWWQEQQACLLHQRSTYTGIWTANDCLGCTCFFFCFFFLLKPRLQSHFVVVNCGVFWWWD